VVVANARWIVLPSTMPSQWIIAESCALKKGHSTRALSLCLFFDIRFTVLKHRDGDLSARVFFVHEYPAAIVRGKNFVVIILDQSSLDQYIINRLKVIGEITWTIVGEIK
jgi:hypothetical protein